MKLMLSFFVILLFAFTAFSQSAGNNSAPDFNVKSIDGKIFDSAALKGKIIVLNLWFVNCPHCIEEIKLLNPIVDEYGSKDVVFIGLATNNESELKNFLRKNPFKYNIVANAGDFMLFGFGEKQKDGSYFLPFPTHVVIDRNGKIISQTSGIKGVEVVKANLAKAFPK